MIFVCIRYACVCGTLHKTFGISIDLVEFNIVLWEPFSDFNNVKRIDPSSNIMVNTLLEEG
jgi:hypothetical protein